jgi:hypothetical protein
METDELIGWPYQSSGFENKSFGENKDDVI